MSQLHLNSRSPLIITWFWIEGVSTLALPLTILGIELCRLELTNTGHDRVHLSQ